MKFGPRRTEAEVAAARLARVKRKPKALQCLTHKVSNSSDSIYISKKVQMRSNCSAGPRFDYMYARPVPAIVRFRPIRNRINVEKHKLLYIMPAST